MGILSDLAGGLLGSFGSSKATDTTVNNLGKGIAGQSNAYNTIRSDFAPWQTTGGNAMIALADALGISRPTTFPGAAGGGYLDRVGAPVGGPALDGSTPSGGSAPGGIIGGLLGRIIGTGAGGATTTPPYFPPGMTVGGGSTGTPGMTPQTGFQASPGYQWQFNEGVRAVDSAAATDGLLGSGARLKALTKFGQGVANQDYYNYLGKLFDMSRMGAAATERVADAGMGTAKVNATLYSGIGDAKAGNATNQANIWGDVLSGATTGPGGGFGGSPLDKLFKLTW